MIIIGVVLALTLILLPPRSRAVAPGKGEAHETGSSVAQAVPSSDSPRAAPSPTASRPAPAPTAAPTPSPTAPPPPPPPIPTLAAGLSLRVVGNHLVNASGQPVRLLGVNHSGTEYACLQGWGIFEGPTDAAALAAIAGWHANAIRVPLNQDCWLDINGVNPAYGGANYQNAIAGYLQRIHQAGLYAILDLHWNAPGTVRATGQQVMADADHAPAFWQSVAATFRNDPAVVFDLYNEPHDVSWSCWRDGCSAPGWPTAGMQSLVTAVRSSGATQPIMLGGLQWANDLSQWLSYEPSDPARALTASFHVYNFNGCIAAGCWTGTVAPVASRVPVVTGELGENDCAHGFIDQYMAWADAHSISYLGWTWNVWSCTNGPALITDYSGTPTGFGQGLRDHLLAVNP